MPEPRPISSGAARAVTVTNHGRDGPALVAADEFERLQAQDARPAYYAHALPEGLAEAQEPVRAPTG